MQRTTYQPQYQSNQPTNMRTYNTYASNFQQPGYHTAQQQQQQFQPKQGFAEKFEDSEFQEEQNEGSLQELEVKQVVKEFPVINNSQAQSNKQSLSKPQLLQSQQYSIGYNSQIPQQNNSMQFRQQEQQSLSYDINNNKSYKPMQGNQEHADLNMQDIKIEIDKKYIFIENPNQRDSNDKMIQIIQFDQQTKIMQYNKQFLDLIENCQGKIAFVGFYGTRDSGKSLFYQHLVNSQQPYKDKTEGIWMWTEPFVNEKENLYIYFIECKDCEDSGQSQFDFKYLILTILLSSILVIVNNGELTEISFNNLRLLANAQRGIQISEFGEQNENYSMSYIMPKFITILNQFSMDQNANQYFETKLSLENQQGPLKQLKDAIRATFKDRECFFCQPATNEQPQAGEQLYSKLRSMRFDQMSQNYQKDVNTIRQLLILKCVPKQMFGSQLNNRMFASYLQYLIKTLNDGQGLIDLTKTWNYVTENQCKIGVSQAYQLFENTLYEHFKEQQQALVFEQVYDKLQELRDQALEIYFKIAGIKQKNQFYQQYKELLLKQIDAKEDQVLDMNEQIAQNSNNAILDQYSSILNQKLENYQYKAQNVQEFLEDFSKLLTQYDQQAVGTQKAEILIDYLMKIHPTLIKSFVKSIEQKHEIKDIQLGQQDLTHQQEQEQLLKNNIKLIQEKIKIFEDKITKLEQEKVQLENQKTTLTKNIDIKMQQQNVLHKQKDQNIPQQKKLRAEKEKEIEKLKAEINLIKNRYQKKSGCCCQ